MKITNAALLTLPTKVNLKNAANFLSQIKTRSNYANLITIYRSVY